MLLLAPCSLMLFDGCYCCFVVLVVFVDVAVVVVATAAVSLMTWSMQMYW